MQFELPFGILRPRLPREDWLKVGSRRIRLHLVRNRRARRYILRLRLDGSARVTVPRGGSQFEAKRFAAKNVPWLERELLRQATRPRTPAAWLIGTQILFRGEPTRLEPGLNGETGWVRLGTEAIRVRDLAADLRPEIERHLWRLAAREFPPRVLELAALHQLPVQRVTVRNQRSRWGSCSRRGTISLNWRLIQTPVFVRDYLIFHELAHLKEMNHSRRFWREVQRLCPNFAEAERWLKKHSELLR
jgi:predicted metal-dependent hydrolase